jgi:isopenicillin N synthase-like dioxygenase
MAILSKEKTYMNIAVVDYQDSSAPRYLAESLRATGFAVLINHPLPAALVRQVQDEWLAFLDSPAKWDYLPAQGAQDGYNPLKATETALGATTPDIKEFFHWYPWGQHPSAGSEQTAALYQQAMALGTTVLGWLESEAPPSMSAALSQPLSTMLEGSRRTLLRVLRYPPVTGEEQPGSLRAGAHEDIDLLTVLPAATHPGLQVLDRQENWHDVPCDLGSVVINGGDMLALASGGYYPSTTHRVLLPDGPEGRQSRVATPLFLHPADDVELASGVTALDFLRQRLRQVRQIELAD